MVHNTKLIVFTLVALIGGIILGIIGTDFVSTRGEAIRIYNPQYDLDTEKGVDFYITEDIITEYTENYYNKYARYPERININFEISDNKDETITKSFYAIYTESNSGQKYYKWNEIR